MIKLLVVDDEDTIREYIRYVFKEENIDAVVEEAHNGKEAIEKAAAFRPDIVLLDIRMPGMEGLEAGRTIKSSIPDIKIIILTAYDEFTYAHEALRLGADDYLLKPISPKDLIQAVNNALTGRNMPVIADEGAIIRNSDLEAELLESIKYNRRRKAVEILGKILPEDREFDIIELKGYLVELMGIIIRIVVSLGIDKDFLSELKENKQKQILRADTSHFLKKLIKDFIVEVSETVSDHYLSPVERAVVRAKDFIQNNYASKIYLKDVAEHVNLSPHYLSRIFKQQTGMNFSQYLNAKRIEKAKEYIGNFDLSLRAVSEKVGYDDFSYFSMVFNKYAGCLPSEFRKRIRENMGTNNS
ncbi:MAG: hypothetical protein HPY66_1880 [Firmicutes bacterium]|nr:hypothetical protein [Bacillota bacterium]